MQSSIINAGLEFWQDRGKEIREGQRLKAYPIAVRFSEKAANEQFALWGLEQGEEWSYK